MSKFYVELKKVVDDSYDIEVGRNLFDTLVNDLKGELGVGISKYAIITDSNVKPLYGDKLYERLVREGFKVDLISFPAGEKSKVRATKEMIEDEMLAKGHRRDSCIIALGGGVVTDLAGFVAGTFGRGIPFINYSTSILGSADASVGGKTAVDTPLATNLIGLIYQPKKVYIDLATWETLPKEQISNGLAETIKHACLADKVFFEYLEEHIQELLEPNGIHNHAEVCEHIAEKNCKIKYEVVKQDERETNLRQILNLGHTIGRAIETLSDYTLLHGEAVAIGLAMQAQIGEKLGYVSTEEVERVMKLIEKAGLPTKLSDDMPTDKVVQKLYTDKKVRSGKIRFVFQEGIGSVKQFEDENYSIALEEDFIREIIDEIR
ncbi:MAG: 3-dehydroquinate synthase [Cellulosilyticum sp.]|nr:3-dehydroquinate synthase [Cellulosilyticum sp.]